MNQRLAMRRLWWKELRQLLPLGLMVAGMPLFFLVLVVLVGPLTSFESWDTLRTVPYLLLGAPILFAIGVGGMLVGQEKELGTLGWLSSLPIAARDIVRVKLGASFVGLAMVWLSMIPIYGLSLVIAPGAASADMFMLVPMLGYSAFLLATSLALAWRFKSGMVSLFGAVPMAVLALVVASIVDGVVIGHGTTDNHVQTATVFVTCYLLFCGALLWLVERFGMQALAPANIPQAIETAVGDHRRTRTAVARNVQILRPFVALEWQFTRQNLAVLIGTSILLAVAVVAPSLIIVADGIRYNHHVHGVATAISFCCGFFAINWLAIGAYQGDTIHQRIRFLADRGISPRLAWLTRHTLPISILTLFVGSYSIIACFCFGFAEVLFGPSASVLAAFAGVVVLNYSVGQWIGQVVLSPVVAAIVGPIAGLVAIAYGVISVSTLGAPWWFAALVAAIPVIATYTMMRRWMDRRFGLSYWCAHGAVLAATLLIPAIPLFSAILLEPSMSPQTAQELDEVFSGSHDVRAASDELSFSTWEPHAHSQSISESGQSDSISSEKVTEAPVDTRSMSLSDQIDRTLADIANQLSRGERSLGVSSKRVTEYVKLIGQIARMSIDKDANDKVSTEKYRQSVRLIVRITERMRLSPQIIDQDSADYLEIWLLSELKREQSLQRLGQEIYEESLRMLADQAGRNEARRRAVAHSWHSFKTSTTGRDTPLTLGGYDLVDLARNVGNLKSVVINQRRVGMAVADLWSLVQGDSQRSPSPELLKKMADFWEFPASHYGLEPTGGYLRADDLGHFVFPMDSRLRGVASQWSAGWEREAIQLARANNRTRRNRTLFLRSSTL